MELTYKIFTDTTTDLTPEWMTENNVGWLEHGIVIDGKEIKDDFGKTVPHKDFYQRLRSGLMPTTTQVDIPTFTNAYEQALQQGLDVIYIGFSSKLSGTFNTSLMVEQELMEKYPGRRVISFDTAAAGIGQGMIVMEAARLQQQGMSLDELVDEALPRLKKTICHFFTVDDLNHLYRGGRLSRSSAFLGTLMGIKPVMYVSDEGKLEPLSKVRGRRQAIAELARLAKEHVVNPQEQTIYICHADCREDADELARLVKEQMNPKGVDIRFLTPIIGNHSGPGTLAVFGFGNSRL